VKFLIDLPTERDVDLRRHVIVEAEGAEVRLTAAMSPEAYTMVILTPDQAMRVAALLVYAIERAPEPSNFDDSVALALARLIGPSMHAWLPGPAVPEETK